MVPPASSGETTKTELVTAARDLLLEGGLSGLSMRKVASSVGLSATAIYRHYEDKDALVAAAVVEGFRTFATYLLDALEEDTPIERYRLMVRRYFDFAREHSQDYRLIFMTDCNHLGFTRLDEIAQREVSGTFQLLQDRIAECQGAGVFRKGDPRALAAFTWASVHGLASLLLTQQLGETEEETTGLIELHLSLVESGLRA
jgi:AcrR family transcriptional regulator